MPKLDIPLVPYMSPCFQFARFQAIIDRYGEEEVLTRGRFQKERESWIAAAFLMGLSEYTERFWWLTVAPDGSPDLIAASPRREAHGWVADRLDLEIFEYERRAPIAGVTNAIERKLKNKAYPADYRLVCYAHHRHGEAFNTGEVAEQVKGLQLKAAEVWLVGSIEGDYSEDFVVSRVHPEPWEHRFSYLQYCAETPQIRILNAGEGSSEEIERGFMEIELP